MDAKGLYEKLTKGESVYLFDDFEVAAFRLTVRKDRSIAAFCKRKGQPEYNLAASTVLVTEARLTGREITEKDYMEY